MTTTDYSALPVEDLLNAFRDGQVTDLVAEAVRRTFQQLIDAEATQVIGARPWERTDDRATHRNGHRDKTVMSKSGDMHLRIPKLRAGSFFPSILEPRRRIDQALHAVVMEAYVNGVSTRNVDDLVAALGGTGISKSEVSRICQELDEFVDAFRNRSLSHARFPYVYLDATYVHVRETTLGQVTSKAVVVATGVRADGHREVLGLDVGDSEDESFWTTFLRSLKTRGLSGVMLVISDQHAGLVASLGRCFAGASHQRCRVHFARNLLALFPKTHTDMAAALFRSALAGPTPQAISDAWEQVRNQLASVAPKAGPLMDDAKAEVTAFTVFPREHWRQIWSNNPLERINKEIKKRSRVVGIFPNQAAVTRLVGAILADIHDEWVTTDHRYLSEETMNKLTTRYDEHITALDGDQHAQLP